MTGQQSDDLMRLRVIIDDLEKFIEDYRQHKAEVARDAALIAESPVPNKE